MCLWPGQGVENVGRLDEWVLILEFFFCCMCRVIDGGRCVAQLGDADHCGRLRQVEAVEGRQRELARGRAVGVSVKWRETIEGRT